MLVTPLMLEWNPLARPMIVNRIKVTISVYSTRLWPCSSFQNRRMNKSITFAPCMKYSRFGLSETVPEVRHGSQRYQIAPKVRGGSAVPGGRACARKRECHAVGLRSEERRVGKGG